MIVLGDFVLDQHCWTLVVATFHLFPIRDGVSLPSPSLLVELLTGKAVSEITCDVSSRTLNLIYYY